MSTYQANNYLNYGNYKYIYEGLKFGKHILALRKRITNSNYPNRSISQQELSYRSEFISKKTIGEIERGRTNPEFDTLVILANALNVTLKDLFDY